MKKIAFSFILFLCVFLTNASAATVTGFTEKFNAGTLPAGWAQTPQYLLGVTSSELVMTVNKSKAWQSFVFTPTNTIDFSANPYVAIKLRATKNMRFMVYLVDASNNVVKHANVRFADNKYTDLLIDFSSPGSVNLSAVTKLYIGVNGDALTWKGQVFIDEIRLAGDAVKIASLSTVLDQNYFQGTTGNSFLVSDIANASSIQFEGAETLVDNISVGPITGGMSTVSFNAKAGVSGTVQAKVITQPNSGFVKDTALFNLTVEANQPPTATVPATVDIKSGSALSFDITDITDGNIAIDQSMTFTLKKISGTSIGSMVSSYDKQKARINVTGQALSSGTTSYKLVIKDSGGGLDSLVKTINVISFVNFNYPPSCVVPVKNEFFISEGSLDVPVTGISDGNSGTQSFTYAVTSLNPEIATASIGFINGNPMEPKVICNAVSAGLATMELTITDDDFGFDNGAKSTTQLFPVQVKPTPVYGLDININNFVADTTNHIYKLEQPSAQVFSKVVFDGHDCIKIQCTGKPQWSGFWYRNPEMDVSANPFIEYEMYCDKTIQTHAYFYDSYNQRNEPGAHAQRKTVPKNTWTKVLMDFRGFGMMVNKTGTSINSNAIDSILFNYNESFPFPTVTFTGTIYIRSIKSGNTVVAPALTPVTTIDNPGNVTYFKGDGAKKITINNISCGSDCTTTPTVTFTNSSSTILSGVSLSPLNGNSIDLNFTVGANTGTSNINVTVAAPGSTSTSRSFSIVVLNNTTSATTLNVDTLTKKQVIAGLGGASPKIELIDQFVSSGATTIRMFFKGDEVEPINDNSSPFAIEPSKFLSAGLNVDYIKAANLAGIKDFMITVLSPPSWMKQNMSEDYSAALSPAWASTLNKVDPIYYDEYVEFMVGIVQLVKERTGVEIMGICPQNEPTFCEPYGSAILDPDHMAIVCGKLGKKLNALGYKTKVVAGEQVFVQNVNSFTDAVQADADANQYTAVIGMHYPKLDAAAYQSQYNNAKTAPYPKEYWGTEMNAIGNDWTKVLDEMEIMVLGLNNGVGYWAIYGWNGSAIMNNSQNAVGSQLAMVYGNVPSKHFYAAKNVFKFFRPDSKIVTSTLSTGITGLSMVGNLNSKDSVVSVVWVNKSSTNVVATLGASLTPNSGTKVFRTAEFQNYEVVTPYLVDKIILQAKSVTTLVIPNNKAKTITVGVPAVQADNSAQVDFQLAPNPAISEVRILSNSNAPFNISIIDMTGRRLQTQSNLNAGEAVNISNIKPGLYNVVIKGEKTLVKKLVIR